MSLTETIQQIESTKRVLTDHLAAAAATEKELRDSIAQLAETAFLAQDGIDLAALEAWDFAHFLVQPMDCAAAGAAREAAIALAMARPRWRLTLQAHKALGLR